MRNKWVASCVVLLAMTSAAFAQPQELTGNDVLQNTLKAYAKLDRYVGTCVVSAHIVRQEPQMREQDYVITTHANIEFNRSAEATIARVEDFGEKSHETQKPLEFSMDAGKIIIKGVGLSNTPFSLIGDNKTATVTVAKASNGKERVTKDDISLGLAGLTGIGYGAATIIPSVLLDTRFGNPLKGIFAPQLQGTERIGIWACYKVTNFEPISNIKSTFWVDYKSFLLRQYQTESGEVNLEAAKDKPAEIREALEESQQSMKKYGLKSKTMLLMIGIEEAQ